ncbi:Morphology and auto-aggregation control protein [Pannonibacter phragmitetus]|uniref:Morphology and auto-aggregation control protein n=2 Tax=Pannonibacter phragmitetus TaxID=121719 RepID=A0A378ZXR2_9HYPH|nr:Morphology and auto-aggregation control protein [Pannonibacter phragmitetus]
MASIDIIYLMPYRPSHRQLEYLVAVAEHGHFGRAARACHVSQPTLSAQLKLLEDRLGVVLIDRGGAIVQPTPAGHALLPHARTVLETLDEFVREAQAADKGLGGLIRLGVAPTAGPYLLTGVIELLQERVPGLQLYIREERPSLLETAVREGTVDCILTPLPVRESRLISEDLCVEQIYLGLPQRHPLAAKTSLSVPDLLAERMLTLGRGHRLYDQVQSLCAASGAVMSEDYEGTSLDALRQMVSIGMGLSLFPAAYVASEFARERQVVLRELSGWPMQRLIVLAWREGSPRQAHFLRLAKLAREGIAASGLEGVSLTEA